MTSRVYRRASETDEEFEARRWRGILARLEAKSRRDGECVVWTGTLNEDGYGLISSGSRRAPLRAHRAAWIARHGMPAAETPHVLHRCDNPACWREEHLWLGTHADNMADMAAKGRTSRYHSRKTHCPRGHPYDEANTYIRKNGARSCRKCTNRARDERRKQ